MSRCINTCLITLCLSLLAFYSAMAQEGIAELDLDELAHVDIEKKTMGIIDRKPHDPDHLYLGLLVSYSKMKEFSLEIKHAVEMAIDEINASGGVLGKKLDLATADDGGHKELATLYADSLVRQYHVSAIIGPAGSSRVIHIAKNYLPNNPMLLISPSASSREISDLADDDLVWRAMPSDALQARIAADYIFDKLNRKSVGILYTQDAYGMGLRDELKKNFKGTVLSEVGYSPLIDLKSFDLTEKLNMLFNDKPEAIFFAASGSDIALITTKLSGKKYIHAQYKPALFGVDASKSNDLLTTGSKKIVEGMSGTDLKRGSTAFRDKYFQRYYTYPELSDSERAYDIVYIVALAMEKGKSQHFRDVKNNLRAVTEGTVKTGPGDFAAAREKISMNHDIYYEGASGLIKFDHNGDLSTGIFEIWKIEKGKFITVDLVPFRY